MEPQVCQGWSGWIPSKGEALNNHPSTKRQRFSFQCSFSFNNNSPPIGSPQGEQSRERR
jgi:hypothetical protein